MKVIHQLLVAVSVKVAVSEAFIVSCFLSVNHMNRMIMRCNLWMEVHWVQVGYFCDEQNASMHEWYTMSGVGRGIGIWWALGPAKHKKGICFKVFLFVLRSTHIANVGVVNQQNNVDVTHVQMRSEKCVSHLRAKSSDVSTKRRIFSKNFNVMWSKQW